MSPMACSHTTVSQYRYNYNYSMNESIHQLFKVVQGYFSDRYYYVGAMVNNVMKAWAWKNPLTSLSQNIQLLVSDMLQNFNKKSHEL